jgi:1,4-dihydroxy-2-naphthoate octaprenyltransferase
METVFSSMRGKFLILTPVCVFLGISTVVAEQVDIEFHLLFLALAGALLAHISVNTINEYLDFKSGLDLMTQKTGFSGGSGALPRNPEKAGAVLATGIISLLATTMIGLYFVSIYGGEIIPIGLAGLVLIVAYTGWINKHPLLCLIAPGIGFGFLMVAGTQFVLTGYFSTLAWLVASIPFLLVNNLLLLNQYPDIHADTKVGRYHLPIAYGIKTSNIAYAFFAVMTILVITSAIVSGYIPALSLIAILPMPLAFYSLYGAITHGEGIGEHQHYLGANVAVTLTTPLLLGIALIIG